MDDYNQSSTLVREREGEMRGNERKKKIKKEEKGEDGKVERNRLTVVAVAAV